MRRTLYRCLGVIGSVAAIVSCGTDGEVESSGGGSTPPFVSESIEVAITATATDFGASALEWREGDKLLLFYDTEGLETPAVSTLQNTSTGTSGEFKGEIFSYEGTKSLYALYARNEEREWVINNAFEVDITTEMLGSYSSSFAQTDDCSAHEMGLLVGMVEGASAKSSTSYAIEPIALEPINSLFQLNLSGTPPDDTEVTKMSLTAESGAPFTTAGRLSLCDGEVTPTSYAQSVESAIESGLTGYSPILLFSSTISESITLALTAIGVDDKEGWEWLYSYVLGSNIEFESGVATCYDLKWSELTTKVVKSVVSASSLTDYASSNTAPEGDTWVINSTEVETPEEIEEVLASLSTILSSDSVEESSVAVELPGVTTLPAETFSGTGENTNSALASVTLNDVTSVGVSAFAANTSVKEVVLGSSSDDGEEVEVELAEGVFTDCTAMTSCVVNTTSLPKATFKGCSSLNTISLSKVTTIGERGCEGCSSLFKETTESISLFTSSRASFATAASIELVFTAIETIGERAFYGCTQFDVIRLNEDSDVVVSSIADDAFSSDAGSYTEGITLYVSGAMKECVDLSLNTLTVGATVLTFKNIYIDGAGDDVGTSGDDAEVEIM